MEPQRGQEFFLLLNVRPGFSGPLSFLLNGYRVKHSGREVYHSSPPSAEVMSEWSCISASPLCLHGVDRDFFLIIHMRPSRRNEIAMRLLLSVGQKVLRQCGAKWVPGNPVVPRNA